MDPYDITSKDINLLIDTFRQANIQTMSHQSLSVAKKRKTIIAAICTECTPSVYLSVWFFYLGNVNIDVETFPIELS